MAKSKGEAFWWSIFSAGGVVAAMLVPIHIFLLGFVIPFWWGSIDTFGYERMRGLLSHPVAKLYLLVLFIFPLFHCAHRIRHTLYDVGWREYQKPIAFACYGAAFLGTIVAAITLLSL
ncbi:MAG: fumarate reductase subunit FrdD [Candidatus Binatia bacterium]